MEATAPVLALVTLTQIFGISASRLLSIRLKLPILLYPSPPSQLLSLTLLDHRDAFLL